MALSLLDAAKRAIQAIGGWQQGQPGARGAGGGPSRCLRVEGLTSGARALLIARVARESALPALVIAPGAEEAEALAEDLRLFLDRGSPPDPFARQVSLYPSRDVPLFEPISPPRQLVAGRLMALFQLTATPAHVVVTTPEALIERVIPPRTLTNTVCRLAVGAELPMEEFVERASQWGYQRVPQVEDCGEFSVRGGIVDIFPPGYERPIRVDFAADVIETVRDFDPVSQRSAGQRNEAVVLPAQEYSLSQLRSPSSRRAVEMRAAELGMPRRERVRLIEAWSSGLALPGVEFLLPYLYPDGLSTLLDYLPPTGVIWIDDPARVEGALEEFAGVVEERASVCEKEGKLFAPPQELFAPVESFREIAGRWPLLEIEPFVSLSGPESIQVACAVNQGLVPSQGRDEALLDRMSRQLARWQREGYGVVVVVQDEAQARRVGGILEGRSIEATRLPQSADLLDLDRPGVFIVEGGLSAGFSLAADLRIFVAESEIFGERRKRAPQRRVRAGELLSSMADLHPKDYVVHLDHGIGIYRGLTHLKVAGTEGDYLHLEYAGGDRLYLPVDRINMIQKYMSADGSAAPLDKLGSGSWEKVKARTRKSIFAMARELVEIHATRQVLDAPGYRRPDGYYDEFAARFPFEETPDQERAIDEVLVDLEKAKPMDRLVCGDVGYGKTEVALRAAFIVVLEGSQVAVLVPTTVLARQHYETFRQRFAGYPVRVEMLSRLLGAKESRQVIEGLASGVVDILIGTHRLLQEDIVFKRLGLLVIDEEHRFGVVHKERIKKLKKLVDVLTLTATPIPRTLHMALVGLRDLSVIETPPVDRLAIRTFITRYDEGVVRAAVLSELKRGGQVFFVHNRVETIDSQAARLQALIPEASIAVAHGQMRIRALEKVMLSFLEKKINLLVCSAIIESGLDIPSANTIIINRADTFGLAQLYQLRGRVGRSHLRAYAYLLIPGEQMIGREAHKRLTALQQLDELGGGFKLAAHDLEIRGAGNLLGREQSGHIKAVGFELYTKMMAEAVREIRGEQSPVEVEPEIQLGIAAYIPESYVKDVNQRLAIYKRLAGAQSREEIDEIGQELEDRFGVLPEIVETLLKLMDLRRMLKENLVTLLKRRGDQLVMAFHPQAPVDPDKLARLLAAQSRNCKLSPDLKLSFVPRGGGIDELSGDLAGILGSIT